MTTTVDLAHPASLETRPTWTHLMALALVSPEALAVPFETADHDRNRVIESLWSLVLAVLCHQLATGHGAPLGWFFAIVGTALFLAVCSVLLWATCGVLRRTLSGGTLPGLSYRTVWCWVVMAFSVWTFFGLPMTFLDAQHVGWILTNLVVFVGRLVLAYRLIALGTAGLRYALGGMKVTHLVQLMLAGGVFALLVGFFLLRLMIGVG